MANTTKEKWVDALLQEIIAGKRYKRIIQKCIDHMENGKKLYKYYDLASPYTLPNIENAENYYSNPTEFNDPFDCNIGISTNQLLRLCLPSACNQLYDTSLDPTIQTMIETLLFGEPEDYDEDSDEAIIEACLSCPDIADLIYKAKSGEDIDDEVIVNVLLHNADILALMLSKYPEIKAQGNSTNLEEQLKLVATNSIKVMRQLLTKASADQTGETKEILAILSEDEDLLTRIQKIARLTGATDQDEQIKRIYDQLDITVKQIHAKIGEMIGITCFSETPINMLMWSHYANKHSGICIEYDFSKLFTTASDTLLFPVTYSNRRPLFPVDKIALAGDGTVIQGQTMPVDALPEIIKAWTIKSKIWSYEREWRHIVFTSTAPNRIVKLPIISKIILGANITDENRQAVIELARKKQIPVYSTHMKSDKYEMVISDVPE